MTLNSSIIGRKVKLVKMVDLRFDELGLPMLYQDEIVQDCLNQVFTVADYDKESNLIAIRTHNEEIWLYPEEVHFVLSNI